jgi:hypothetical protein
MEQIGQAMVEDGASNACSTAPVSAAACKDGMLEAVASTGVEPLSRSAPEESVLDEDVDGVGEPRYCGIS